MKYLLVLIVSILIIQDSVAPPVDKKEKKDEKENEVQEEELGDVMEYHRYLQEVVQALESDPEFRAKLEKTDESDIRSGKIAHELEFVSHNVRTKLDELKRYELERLRRLAIEEYKLENGLDSRHMKISEHVDHGNPHTFEIEDLKKLIAKTTKDLDEADKKRREEFKQYEMNKKFEQEEKMSNMTEEEKKTFENEIHDLEKKHKEHEPLHHPGSKKQLEEVWEKQDHMENQEFDPKTFFYMHDLDGNGVWDPNELKALFLKELDKLYAEGHPEDDLVERAEELERMREHVIREADINKDGLISYEEFINESKKKEFEEDPGWEPLDQQQIYSEQEYEEYRRQKAREIERHIAKGMSQQYPDGHPQAGHEQFPPHPNQVNQDYMHQQAQYHPNQVPQQNYPQQGQYVNQVPPQHGQYNQMPPQQGQYGNQVPQHQGQFGNQVPQHHDQFGNQIPQHQGQFGNQVPQQAGQFGNQVPQYQQQQYHPNQQVPVPNQQHQPPVNQQVPAGQVPPQQYQQQQQQQHVNQVPQQVPQQVPVGQNQVPPQQYHQQPPVQQVPQQPQVNQQQLPVGQVPQQAGQQQAQPANPASNEIHQNQPNQQQVPVAGQNQPNTQNQVPQQQTHEQVASINNAQQHQNVPHTS